MLKSDALIREYLRDLNDGANVGKISDVLMLDHSAVLAVLKAMPDTYIDRWEPNTSGTKHRFPYLAIWCIVTPPSDCPYPGEAHAGT